MSRTRRLLVFVLGVVVLAGSWSVWGSFDAEVDVDPFGFMGRLPGDLESVTEEIFGEGFFGPKPMTFYLSGWNGYVTLYFFDAPNSVAVLAGVFMALLALVPARGRWPAVLALQLAGYGSLHMGMLTVSLAGEHRVWITGWLTLAAFLLATVVLVSGLRTRVDSHRRSARAKAAHAARKR